MLVSLVFGIGIVMVFCNLVAKPSQVTGVPYPVIDRAVFGVRGANIPAIIRGCIAIAWYGLQTYLAAPSLVIIFLEFLPGFAAGLDGVSFLGRSGLGYLCYAISWVTQAEHLVQRYGYAAKCRSIYACEVPVLELDDPAPRPASWWSTTAGARWSTTRPTASCSAAPAWRTSAPACPSRSGCRWWTGSPPGCC